ncbi:expressed unknown protein [Seminavis robusta]|uniref:AraC effector-binding domain-containing protein n=1 Tax=Seminavis robusta TaxID=568900 RepID=A0A9N8HN82_9STRA|nr:expressed unknown protein [Seminavis robusta]|eukprot:Sro1187_g250450.1 n/a (171) ;mRNA; f:9045-9557
MNTPKIIETATRKFWGIVGHGPFDACGPLFKRLGVIKKETFSNTKIDFAMLVLCDVPNTSKDDLVWAAAMVIPPEKEAKSKGGKVPDGLEEIVVAGHRCATMMHHGGYDGLPKSWGKLCMEWIPSQKMCPSKGSRECPHYEIYLNDCSKGEAIKQEDLVTQLFAPVEAAE